MAKKYLGVARDLSNTKLINVADATNPTDAVNLQTAQALLLGVTSIKSAVRVATTVAGTLATSFANGQTVDGVVLATGDRILIKNQVTGADNGIYVVAASGAPTRSTDADTSAKVKSGMRVAANEGTVNGNHNFQLTTDDPIVLATTSLTFADEGATSVYTASLGLTASGNDFRLAASAAGNALTLTSGVLDVAPGTGLEISADTIRIAAAAAGAGLVGGAGSAIDVVATSGGGLTVNANDVGVDSTVSRRYTQSTNANSTTVNVTHGLGVQFLSGVSVYVTATGEMVDCDIVATDTTHMAFTFAVAPTLNTLTFALST